MKICVTSHGNTLGAKVDLRFGRCRYFVIIETETMEFEAIENPNVSAMGGAGVQSAQLIAGKNVSALITGNLGPNAFEALKKTGIELITGASGNIEEMVDKYKKGELNAMGASTVESKFGMGANAMPGSGKQGNR